MVKLKENVYQYSSCCQARSKSHLNTPRKSMGAHECDMNKLCDQMGVNLATTVGKLQGKLLPTQYETRYTWKFRVHFSTFR